MTDAAPGPPDEVHLQSPALIARAAHAVLAALCGALFGAACITLGVARHPGISIDPAGDLRGATGFYPGEFNDHGAFAWTAGTATLTFTGLDRRSEWRCTVRVRGGRGAPLPQASVSLAIDGVIRSVVTTTNEYQDVEIVAPVRRADGLTLSIHSVPTFVPGPADRRELGVQVASAGCRPEPGAWVFPPRRALMTAAATGGAFGAAFALIGLGLGAAVAGVAALGALQTGPLASGLAPYSADYLSQLVSLATWSAGAGTLAALLLARRRRPLSSAARFVIAFAAAALFLQLLALLHPSKAPVDAVFHAHRLEWVLGGRYFFTQPLPSGVQFPYAIGLYVFAAPWSLLTEDRVTLLRVIVCTAHALAGLLVYWAIVRTTADRLAGAAGVVLFFFVPLPFIVIGNANLTYAFAQSIAFLTLAAVAAWPLSTVAQRTAVFLLATLALLSHVGLAPLLAGMLVLAAVLFRWLGGPPLRTAAAWVLVATVAAAIGSVALYYRHFPDAFRSLAQVRAADASGPRAAEQPPGPDAGADRAVPSLPARIGRAVALTTSSLGWPVLVLAALGAWRLRTGLRDRLGLVLLAMVATGVAFVGFRVLMPVDERFQRYADEFVGRVNYAVIFAAASLAGFGFAAAWRSGTLGRIAALALGAFAVAGGAALWSHWALGG